jgi:hypothetical protein
LAAAFAGAFAGAFRATAFFTATFFAFGAADLDAAAFGVAAFADAAFGAAFFAVTRVAFFGAAFFAVARAVVFTAAFFGAARVAFFGAAFLVTTFVAAGFAAFLATGFFVAAVLFAAAFFGAAFLVAALTASATALGRVVFASLVTCRNSFFAVLEDANHSNGCRCGPFRNMQAPRGGMATDRRSDTQPAATVRRPCVRSRPIAPAIRCASDADADVARIAVSGTQRARFLPALLRGRLRPARIELRPIDRNLPSGGHLSSLASSKGESIMRTLTPLSASRSGMSIKSDRYLPSSRQKSAPRHCCRGAPVRSTTRWSMKCACRARESQRREIGTKGTWSGPV